MNGPENQKPRDPNARMAKPGACPVCGKPIASAFRPFCSDRCRMVDLNRWLSEAYRIPASEPGLDRENQSESED